MNTGKIVQVIGPVVDVQFAEDSIPPIYQALTVEFTAAGTKQVLTLEEAVRKMSGFPAARIGLTDRGILRPGMKADIVVFDPATIIDRATFEKPHQYAEGVSAVLVNGQLALADGQMTGTRAGRTLRKTQPR